MTDGSPFASPIGGIIDPQDDHDASPEPAKATPPKGPAPLLHVADLCTLFRRDPRSIRRWIKAGHLHPIRVGGSIFFDPEDVQALIAKRLRR